MRIKQDMTLAAVAAGFVAVLVGYASAAVIIFQAAANAGASQAEVTSWFLALGIGMGVTTIGLSLAYRIPVLTAWSTPGAALLVTGLADVGLPAAVGAFMLSAVLMTLVGITGWFARLMRYIPQSLAAAMLAGVLLQFGLSAFASMETEAVLVLSLFALYLVGKRWFPRYAIVVVLLAGLGLNGVLGLTDLSGFEWTLARPVFIAPEWSWRTLIGVGIPLFVVTMASQNMPGVAAMRAAGYEPPVSSAITWTGLTTLVLAPFGAFALNLAAITAAICMSPDVHPDRRKRYTAALAAGIFYLISGLMAASVAAVFYGLPEELVLTLAGLALLSTITSSLAQAVRHESEREAAVVTLLVTASGLTLWSVGSAFWGLVAGLIAWWLWRRPELSDTDAPLASRPRR